MKSLSLILALALATPAPAAQKEAAPTAPAPLVEFEMMTWPEVKKAIEGGKTIALVYNGGTEQRGPQNVNGGHTLMGRDTVRAIALKLGHAIAAPVLPFSPNRASAELPGTIGDPILPRGQAPDPNAKRLNNGISGDGRKCTAELGKRLFDMKVDYAVAQIQKLIAPK